MQTVQGKALNIENLSKSFGQIEAVKGLNLQVEKGEIFGLLGPNGAGKSTTIKIITGLLKPDSGTVKIFDNSMASASTRERIGLCPQELVIWESLTLMEQLIMIAQMYDIPYKTAKCRAYEMLETMGLSEKRNKLGSTLSGGMKRRLNILLALMHQPDIVILDEPQAGLDPQSRVLVREYIRSIARRKTIIITTHDMEEADKLADRVAIIDNGRILVEDTPQRLKESVFKGEIIEFFISPGPGKDELNGLLKEKYPVQNSNSEICTVVSLKPYDTLKELGEVFARFGRKPEDVRIRRATLEDVFISLTGRGLRE
jgi:ABC-2 type transport system ATP-binding protein